MASSRNYRVGGTSNAVAGMTGSPSRTSPQVTCNFFTLSDTIPHPACIEPSLWADSACQGPALAKAFARHGVRIKVVRRSDGQRGFVVLARRWVVERTLSWLSRSRRLNRDHERRPDHHQQMVWWAATIRLSRRMAA